MYNFKSSSAVLRQKSLMKLFKNILDANLTQRHIRHNTKI